MNVRGPVVDVGETRTVSGGTELAEVTVRPERGAGAPTQVTLWRKWAESADYLEPGMELLVTDVETDEWQGETQYATTPTSWVVVEPDFLVDVTGIRAWVQCPRMYYLNKLQGVPLKYPVVKGTVVHEVFGDLLRGGDLDESVDNRVAEAALDIGLLGLDADEVAEEVRANAAAIEAWLQQGTLTETDSWRSEQTLISETFGIKGRADAVRRGAPVELKTGKNTKGEPRFQDKVQAACYALLLGEFADVAATDGGEGGGAGAADAPIDGGGETAAAIPDTGTLIYTKNAALDRSEASGDLSPAKDFSIGRGFAEYVLRERNHLAAMEHDHSVPTGYEANAKCEYCFEQDPCMAVAGRLEQEAKAGAIPGIAVPDEEQAYFDRFYRAIEAERREVHREYRKLWEQGATERADDDRALIDLEPAGRERRADGRWVLRARRPGEAVSKIREGDLVLASEGHPTRTKAELARIESLGGADDAVVLTADEPLDVRRLDVYPSELTVDRQLNALHDAVLAGDEARKDVLFGRRDPSFRDDHGTYIDNNAAQDEAVNLALNAEDFALVHGPPGTGKTYTLATLVRALVEQGERVLLSAFTNRAVDNALEALREQGFEDVLRVGSESGVRADMHEHLLDETGDPDRVAGDLREAPVVAATTASCGSRAVKSREFDVAVVDEAGQLTEPGTFLATNRADRFVLVGDHQQLPPVVRAESGGGEQREPPDSSGERSDPREHDLQESLFERLIEAHPDAGVMLTRQYRMSQRVQWFASEEFYDGELRPATPEVAGQRLGDLSGVDPGRLPGSLRDAVSFVDPDGRQVGNTNPAEADAVADAVRSYLDAGVDPDDIGVIAPFRAQVAEIGKRLDGTGVTVDTVDRFQGSAEEVIVVSVVATGTVESPVFEDHRRMNVALTRAKKAVALVGDRDALESDAFYRRLLRWAEG